MYFFKERIIYKDEGVHRVHSECPEKKDRWRCSPFAYPPPHKIMGLLEQHHQEKPRALGGRAMGELSKGRNEQVHLSPWWSSVLKIGQSLREVHSPIQEATLTMNLTESQSWLPVQETWGAEKQGHRTNVTTESWAEGAHRKNDPFSAEMQRHPQEKGGEAQFLKTFLQKS